MAALPLIGAATAYPGRPPWWGALLATALDLVFLLVVALVVAGLAWPGARIVRRLRAARA